MTYTLTVNNTGTANATGVKVVDTLPAGVTGITATGTSLFVCGVAGQTVTCDGGAVNQGANATVTINATAPSATGTITNTAVVDPDNTIRREQRAEQHLRARQHAGDGVADDRRLLTIDKTDGSPAVARQPRLGARRGARSGQPRADADLQDPRREHGVHPRRRRARGRRHAGPGRGERHRDRR